jgi:hypothetical protein
MLRLLDCITVLFVLIEKDTFKVLINFLALVTLEVAAVVRDVNPGVLDVGLRPNLSFEQNF